MFIMKRIVTGLLAALLFLLFGCTTSSTDPATQFETSSSPANTPTETSEMITPEQSIQSPNIGTLIRVPSGSFQRDENPENISTVEAFLMAQHEVTRAEFVEVTGLDDPSLTDYSHGEDDPVQSVVWYHTLVFCNRLSEMENLTPVYSIDGSTDPDEWGRVPTSDDEV